jgi:NAD(P)-dependent dehydrogenase (short-subunit alcohol dehydrogenase family)
MGLASSAMMTSFQDKVVIVTGGASGIGRAAAVAFARAGARVAVVDREERGVLADIERGLFVAADVTRAADVEAMVARVVRELGRLDFAFNNAGVAGAQATTAEYDEAEWDRVIATNLKGTWLCMKYEIPHLTRGAAIVNCASISGLIAFENEPAYVASKHAIVGLTKTAAIELGPRGIRVNALCPGAVDTPMLHRTTPPAELREYVDGTPLRRVATPEEIAAAAVWLCSDAAAFVTGVALPVDGGWVAR